MSLRLRWAKKAYENELVVISIIYGLTIRFLHKKDYLYRILFFIPAFLICSNIM